MDETFTFKPIGYLKSCYPTKFGIPRQSGIVKKAYSELKIRADLQPEISLQGLEGYSHLWLEFIFHLNTASRYHAKVHPPRLDGKSIGLFATRSPHRPNPLGLSLVQIVEVKSDGLILAGADLVDGTPILDIKPYLPQFESLTNARDGWMGEVKKDEIEVQFTEPALEILQKWTDRTGQAELKEVIIDILKQDPRPVIYKGYEAGESPYRNKHAFKLYDGDIHFEFISAQLAQVFDIRF